MKINEAFVSVKKHIDIKHLLVGRAIIVGIPALTTAVFGRIIYRIRNYDYNGLHATCSRGSISYGFRVHSRNRAAAFQKKTRSRFTFLDFACNIVDIMTIMRKQPYGCPYGETMFMM